LRYNKHKPNPTLVVVIEIDILLIANCITSAVFSVFGKKKMKIDLCVNWNREEYGIISIILLEEEIYITFPKIFEQ
jgi:hypothetical protein